MNVHATTPAQCSPPHTHKGGLRMVAVFEALKGALALASAYFLTVMIRRDVDFEEAAEHILFSLHINPSRHWSQEFLHAADKISGVNLAMISIIAITYASLRFAEGYGLWKQRAWAVLGINILVVLYIAWVRWDEITAARQRASAISSAGG
jgi:uncharacterized membrane protein (DUF2068 family)